MTIAVLGATGQLGRRTVAHLIDLVGADQVIAVARTPSKASDLGVTVRQGDYNDLDSLQAAFAGVETVHLIPSTAMPRERVQQVQNAIDAAKAAGVRRLVHVGILGTDVTNGFVIMPYLLYAESAIATSGLAYTLLRNAYYADPIADWLPDLVKLGTVPYPTGRGAHPWASRDDMARAAAAVLASGDYDGEGFDLTGPVAHTTEDLCDIVQRVTGSPIAYRDASEAEYIASCLEAGEPEPFARLLATLYTPVRDGLTSFATNHIEQLTGQAPEPLDDFLRRQWMNR